MKAYFTSTDAISRELRARLFKLDGAGRTGALEVMGMIVRDRAVEAFTDAGLRVAPWRNKKDGTPATLVKTGALKKSYRVTATPRVVEIASDRPYALRHQLGDAQPGMPARPMLPVDAAGELPVQLKEDISAALWDYLEG